jgi:microcystin-dependent protein
MTKRHQRLAAALALLLGGAAGYTPAASAQDDCFIGEVRFFAGNFAPRNWQLAHGQLLAIAQNTALFSILGTTYGGDGRTNFALPDLRGRAAVGAGRGPGLSDYPLGAKQGVESVTLNVTQMPPHSHGATTSIDSLSVVAHAVTAAGNSASPAGNLWAETGRTSAYATGAADTSLRADAVTASGTASTSVASTGGGQPVSVVQPVQALTPIICVTGIFPSRN